MTLESLQKQYDWQVKHDAELADENRALAKRIAELKRENDSLRAEVKRLKKGTK